MAHARSAESLRDLFVSETVVDLPRIQMALDGASAMTAFRCLMLSESVGRSIRLPLSSACL